jgi:hypothetical protein
MHIHLCGLQHCRFFSSELQDASTASVLKQTAFSLSDLHLSDSVYISHTHTPHTHTHTHTHTQYHIYAAHAVKEAVGDLPTGEQRLFKCLLKDIRGVCS